ncbi:MAG: hypothetical protein NTU61_02290, partial [Candidatus Altiarchaeota archaeon]|nr:hypothetical protein [Candidatus Altiarchaeota archaeon]
MTARIFKTSVGDVELVYGPKGVSRLSFKKSHHGVRPKAGIESRIASYLAGKKVDFSSVKIDRSSSTQFQRKVWAM